MLTVDNQIAEAGLRVGVVLAGGVAIAEASSELKAAIAKLTVERSTGEFPPAELKGAVRDMLRAGGYKPSGRSKPASEYLVRAAQEKAFPAINNLVDVNNYLSLESGLPISLLDSAKTTEHLLLRFGAAGESYAFNSAGQTIDLSGLICTCAADPAPGIPLGTPVKDSLQGKISEETKSVIGVIYCPAALAETLPALVGTFARMLQTEGRAEAVETLTA